MHASHRLPPSAAVAPLLSRCALLTLAGLLAACGSSTPPMPKGGCGQAVYEWLPRERVGHVISFREDVEGRTSAALVDLAVSLGGGGGVVPPASFGVQLYHLRYSTQDRGQAVEATGLVAVPALEGAPRTAFPMVLYQHGTTGFGPPCAPSRVLGQQNVVPLLVLASQGFVAVAPDYIGLDADTPAGQAAPVKLAYIGIEQTAIGALDMARAAQELLQSRLQSLALPTSAVVLYGASQGGHATFSADLVAPYYAPELDVRAAVALVPATDLFGWAQFGMSAPTDATQFVSASMVALHAWYGGTAPLDALFTDKDPTHFATEIPRLMTTGCSLSAITQGATAGTDIFQPPIVAAATAANWDTVPPWACYLKQNSLHSTPIRRLRRTPTLFVVAQNDSIIPPVSERASFQRLCGLGYQLQYLECAEATHVNGALWSIPEQLTWLKARLAGTPIAAADSCQLKAAVRCAAQR